MAEKVMTLHELCDALGISRRTVRGYEKHGLVKASGRNERGYLLYDAQMQTVIAEIRQLQLFGFPVKEIAALRSLSGKEAYYSSMRLAVVLFGDNITELFDIDPADLTGEDYDKLSEEQKEAYVDGAKRAMEDWLGKFTAGSN